MHINLFPELSPFRQGWLAVGSGHEIHWEISGNPTGIPVVWLHGGPGSSASALHRRFFDPDRFMIVQFDQRGCGKSRPAGCLIENETSDLVNDIERLRTMLGISVWSVVGGSWGGALALAYAQRHRAAIAHLLLRSPFLCSAQEIDLFMRQPPRACQTSWARLMQAVPVSTNEDLLTYGHRIFCIEQDVESQLALARVWVQYESAMNAYPEQIEDVEVAHPSDLIARYQIQCHYLFNACFVSKASLLATEGLEGLKLTLIHGEQDALCPIANSYAIAQAAPGARLIALAGCGHALTTRPMQLALLGEVAKWVG